MVGKRKKQKPHPLSPVEEPQVNDETDQAQPHSAQSDRKVSLDPTDSTVSQSNEQKSALSQEKSAGDAPNTDVSLEAQSDHRDLVKSENVAEEKSEETQERGEEESEEPETGVRLQAPDGFLPALVDLDDLAAVERPRPPPRPSILLWKHLNCCDVRDIQRSTTVDELKAIVGIRIPETLNCTANMTSSILLELLLYVLQFARQEDYDEKQTSVVFSVAKETHDYATSTCFGNVTETFSYFRGLMAAHCVYWPPWSLDLFEPERAQKFCRFFADMYFRHFCLVKAAFTNYLTLDVDIWYDPKVDGPTRAKVQENKADSAPAAEESSRNENVVAARPGTPTLVETTPAADESSRDESVVVNRPDTPTQDEITPAAQEASRNGSVAVTRPQVETILLADESGGSIAIPRPDTPTQVKTTLAEGESSTSGSAVVARPPVESTLTAEEEYGTDAGAAIPRSDTPSLAS